MTKDLIEEMTSKAQRVLAALVEKKVPQLCLPLLLKSRLEMENKMFVKSRNEVRTTQKRIEAEGEKGLEKKELYMNNRKLLLL